MAGTGKIQVLQLAEDLSIGGMERVVQTLALGLPREKYDVKVWCLTKGGAVADELRAAGAEVRVLGMGPRCGLPFLFELRKKLRAERIDILHAHGYSAATVGRAAGLLAGVPVLIEHVHSTYWGYSGRQLLTEKLLGLATAKVICCSRAVADFVQKAEGVPPARTALVYNGCADMRRPPGSRLRSSLGFAADDIVLGTAASLNGHKGHAVLLEALRLAAAAEPRLKAALAGEGPLRGELEAAAVKAGLAGRVAFCGLVRDMGDFLAGVDLAVLPSVEREGLPITVIEAMSAGKAVIGTRVGGLPEAVQEGRTGLLAAPGDPEELARAILALAGAKERREEMGLAGRALYEERFTREKMIEAVSGIYDERLRG